MKRPWRLGRKPSLILNSSVRYDYHKIVLLHLVFLSKSKSKKKNFFSSPQDVDAATAARIALEKQLENLEVEIEFLRRVHKEVIQTQNGCIALDK